jgi:hypothetical protein
MKKLLVLALSLIFPNSLQAQTYSQVQWGIDYSASSASSPNIFYKVGTLWRSLTSASTPTAVYIDAFGAVGNGVTDDSTPLINAIASLNSKGGRVVLSCQKDYYIGQNINVPNNVEIQHCFTPGEWGLAGTGTPNGAFLTMAHVNLASTASFTMNGNSGYYGAVFRAGQTYPSNTIAGYAGTAFTSAAGAIQDVHINALVVGFAICYNGTNRVDRLQLTMDCDANPTASSGAIILGPSADTARIKARAWPWGTYSASGGPTTRTGYGLQVLSGLQDDTHIDFLDYGHSYGVVTAGNGNIHWEHVWTDNNTQYGFFANAGDRSDITAMWIYNSKGARFNANGTWGIGYYMCDTGTVASAECIETAAAASPLINIGAIQITKANLYGINIGSTTAQVNIGAADFKNVNGGIGPYIVGPVNWTTDQIQFGTTPNTDLVAGSSLLGGNPITPPSIASAATLALPVNADNFNVTGTTSITNITGTYGGRTIILNFRGALTLTNGATIGLANSANFTTATGYSIALQYDQTSGIWRELWRSPSSAEALSNGTTGTAGTAIVLQDRPTITNSLTLQGASSPAFIQYNTAAAVNEKYWDSIATGSTLSFRMLQDGYVSAVPWLTVTRSGTTPTLAAFRGPISTGTAGSVLGTLALSGNTSGTITVAPQAAAGTYNFNLPTSAGSSGQPLLSGGGGASAMTFGTLGIGAGGTNCTSASITCFNNITGYTASGATGTTSTNLVFSTSPTLVTPVLGVATGTSLALNGATIGTDALGVTGTATIGTSLTSPLHSGGTTASSTLTLQSTSGAGTSDSIIFNTASQTAAMTLDTGGRTILGTTARNTTLMTGRGNLQVTNNFLTTGTAPDNWIVNTNAFTDEKTWDYFASAGAGTSGTGVLFYRALNDAVGVATTWLGVYRTGTTINTIRFAGTNVGIAASVATVPAYRLDVSGDERVTGARIAGGSAPTGTGTCAISVQTGGNTAGKFQAGNACAIGTTVILTFATTAPTGYVCDAHDQTTPTVIFDQTANTTTAATFTTRGAITGAADAVVFKCIAY